jgi:hypothetical protein
MPIRLARCPDPRLFTICINAFRPRRSAVHRRCLAIVAFRSAFLPSRVIESGCDVEKLPLEVETADFQGGDFTDAKAADCGNEKHDLERVGSCVDDPRNVRLVRHSLCVSKRSNRHSDPSRQDGVYRAGRRCRAGAFADRERVRLDSGMREPKASTSGGHTSSRMLQELPPCVRRACPGRESPNSLASESVRRIVPFRGFPKSPSAKGYFCWGGGGLIPRRLAPFQN